MAPQNRSQTTRIPTIFIIVLSASVAVAGILWFSWDFTEHQTGEDSTSSSYEAIQGIEVQDQSTPIPLTSDLQRSIPVNTQRPIFELEDIVDDWDYQKASQLLENWLQSIDRLHPSDPRKVQAMADILEIYLNNHDSSGLRSLLRSVFGRSDVLDTELDSRTREKLLELSQRNIIELTSFDLLLFSSFEIDNHNQVTEEFINSWLQRGNATRAELLEWERADVFSNELWRAILVDARNNEESTRIILTILENTPVPGLRNSFAGVATLNNDMSRGYLLSYVFSDERLPPEYSGGTPPVYIAWYAAKALAATIEDMPVEFARVESAEKQLETVQEVRNWLTTNMSEEVQPYIGL